MIDRYSMKIDRYNPDTLSIPPISKMFHQFKKINKWIKELKNSNLRETH